MSGPLVLVDGDTIGRARTGDETYTVELLARLPAAAPDLAFAATLRDPADMPLRVPAAVERVALPVGSPYRRIPLALPRAARRLGAGLVHTQYFVAPRLPCPAVVTVHDLSYARAPELFGRRDRELLTRFVPGSVRRARRVIAVSETTRRDLLELYGLAEERVACVHNGVGARFVPQAGAKELVRRELGLSAPYVLFVGALQPRKNATALIDAFARVVRDGAEQELVLAGGDRGGLLDAQARVEAGGLLGRVRFLGHVPDDLLSPLYAAADAFCLPSLYEGFGLPALEAMASGTPVVASATTGLGEAVGDAALTVDPRSVDELERALSQVLGDEQLRADLRARGLARAASFTWERAAAATAEVYRGALA